MTSEELTPEAAAEWRTVPAGDVGRFRGGSGFPLRFQGQASGEVPFFKVSDMNLPGNGKYMTRANHYISEAVRKQLGATLFPAGSIVFAKVGAAVFLERKRILAQPSCIDNNMAAFVLDPARADIEFIHQLLLTMRLGDLVSATALPALNGADLASMQVSLPPIACQREIANVLEHADALLVKLDHLIAKKRDIKQSAMQKLLTGRLRLQGFTGPWDERNLASLGSLLKGRGVTRDQANSGSIACVRYGEIYTTHHDIVRAITSWISPAVAATATRLKQGDVLFAGSGETKEEIGKCVAFIDDFEAYAGGDIVILRPRGVDSRFLGYALNTPEVNRQKANFGQGDAVVHISAAALGSVTVRLPPLDEQVAIGTVLADMDTELAALEARREKTRQLKQGMMQALLTGRIRLV